MAMKHLTSHSRHADPRKLGLSCGSKYTGLGPCQIAMSELIACSKRLGSNLCQTLLHIPQMCTTALRDSRLEAFKKLKPRRDYVPAARSLGQPMPRHVQCQAHLLSGGERGVRGDSCDGWGGPRRPLPGNGSWRISWGFRSRREAPAPSARRTSPSERSKHCVTSKDPDFCRSICSATVETMVEAEGGSPALSKRLLRKFLISCCLCPW